MFRIIAAGAIALAGAVMAATIPDSSFAGKKKYPDPTPRKEQILKLMVKEFVHITPGKGKFPASFLMGAKDLSPSEKPVHKVQFSSQFSIAKYEVTQELYHVVMGGNPSKWKGVRNSVEVTSWDDCKAFCKKATAELRKRKLIGADQEIRLPTEAEWEYCCRAGTKSNYSFGDNVKDLTKYCWYKDNSKGHDPPVGAKQGNAWGLYDMHGYIWEWCEDDWTANYDGAPTDGTARTIKNGKEKVVRGGSWAHPASHCRSDYRDRRARGYRDDKVGFRCVLAQVK